MDGLVHIYTGNGKGKTTTAIGLGIRAAGSGMKVLMVQFCKGSSTNEENTIDKLKPDFEIYKYKQICKFVWQMTPEEKKQMEEYTLHLFNYAMDSSKNKDMIILDEIMAAITNGFIDMKLVVEFIKNKPSHLELVLTGRNAPKELIDLADYVSEINPVKHPMDSGIMARKGIEF
ncbi:cob(I)yrinic acid a,c-diamide adenosyltransferase [Ruminiclostridium herbifermentans]|uniref:Cob(I)yrinic acid a,c-diamide adenosyltransferase n=1 Tax=Ruminiclostridium herbifermentans TaxID=2488810 RepID=A0A4U7JIC0_9FIRM|nr:cob(I)yrinic acid a,c-diamide adenosyltransferase [Ruminiclostridium herbifermentans]QNU67052.1 cob(I)yrinic acid a,c-diamide adenosyltransferase [Ruminiclostridium herbifermentans]